MKRCYHLAFSVGKERGRIEALGFEKDRGRVRGISWREVSGNPAGRYCENLI